MSNQAHHNTISVPETIKTIQSHYDYPMFWQFISIKGRHIYGQRFRLCDEDAQTILKLLIYFLQDQPLAKELGISLHKGIMLSGPVGSGKTSLMNLMRFLLPAPQRYCIKPCRDIAFDYARDGYEVIQRYAKRSFIQSMPREPLSICFDDLGLEPVVQYFGNTCNTMAEIILSRYDYFIAYRMYTHITTNLTAQEIEVRYGTRVRSRMRELFNLISFDKSTPDKRK